MYQNQNIGFNAQNQQNGQNTQQGAQQTSSGRGNRTVVPEAKGALNQMKYEIASELGINLKQGYNGDLPSRQAGYIGGYMVNPMLPEEQKIKCLSLPPMRFTRSRLRGRVQETVVYRVQAEIMI